MLSQGETGNPEDTSIDTLLELARVFLGMDCAFVAEFESGHRVFRHVAARSGLANPPRVGSSDRLAETYCARIAAGEIPSAIPDTLDEPTVSHLSATSVFNVRSHLGTRLVLPDGELYGTLCAFGNTPDPGLGEREVEFLDLVSSLLCERLLLEREEAAVSAEVADRIRTVLSGEGWQLVVQPIVSARTGALVGCEALSRFSAEPLAPPDRWFAEAAEVGLGVDLELRAVAGVIDLLPQISAPYISVNLSAESLIDERTETFFEDVSEPLDTLVIEITEHTAVDDYAVLRAAMEPLRSRGIQFAVDDAGAGYAGLNHILQLSPDYVKLDRALIADVDARPPARALASALTDFGREIGASVVAEGVETESELRALLSVGVDLVQGYLTGRPQPPPLRLEPIVRKLFSQHILLVDDDAVVRAVLRDRLSKGGSTIVGEAADGLEALEAAEQMRPDIIVLDLHMPRLDGLSAIPLLREIAPRAAILAVTSAHDQETAVMQLGAAAYVSKADALDVLPELVDRLRR